MRVTREVLRERVEAGASLLDRSHPDWFLRVNPGTLDVMFEDTCVIGQLFGENYFHVIMSLGEVATDVGMAVFEVTNGFDLSLREGFLEDMVTPNNENYSVLTNVWRELVTARRNEVLHA